MTRLLIQFIVVSLALCPLTISGQNNTELMFQRLRTNPSDPSLLNKLSEAILESSAVKSDSLAVLALKYARFQKKKEEEIKAVVNIYNAAWENGDFKRVILFAEMAAKLYLSAGESTEAAGALNDAALASYETDQYDHSLRNYKRSVNILQKTGDIKNLPSVFTNMAQVFEKTGAYDSSIYYLEKSIRLSQLPGYEAELSASYGNLGFVYKSIGSYSKALENYSAAFKISSRMGDSLSMATDINNIAAIYLHWKNYEMAGRYFRQALTIYEKNMDLSGSEITMANLANMLQQEKKYDSALMLYKKSLKIARSLGREGSVAVKLSNIGMLYHQTGKSDSAIYYLQKSLETGKRLGRTYAVCSSLQNLGEVYLGTGEMATAREYLLEACECAESLNLLPILEKTYRSLGVLYEKSGQPELALEALKKLQAVKDSVFSIRSHEKLAELEAQYKNEIQHKQIELLLQKNQLTETRLNRNRIVIYGLTGVLVFILIASILITILYFQKQKSNKMLVKKNIEIILHEENREKATKPVNLTQINDGEKSRLLIEISRLMKEERIFAREQLSLSDLAKLLNTNTAYLSRLINDHYKTNFPNFINNLRIQEAQRMLALQDFRNQTFEAIAAAVGFHSRSAFNVAFKSNTGVTPGFFLKNLKAANPGDEHQQYKYIDQNNRDLN